MGKSLNKVQLIGNLGKDPELKYTAGSQKAVCTFSIATDESYTPNGGQKIEKTEWHRVTTWDRTAEIAAEYLHKGSKIYIEGKLQTRSWDDKDGVKRYTTEIVARDLILLSGKGESTGSYPPPPGDDDAPMYTGKRPETPPVTGDDAAAPPDDMPF